MAVGSWVGKPEKNKRFQNREEAEAAFPKKTRYWVWSRYHENGDPVFDKVGRKIYYSSKRIEKRIAEIAEMNTDAGRKETRERRLAIAPLLKKAKKEARKQKLARKKAKKERTKS